MYEKFGNFDSAEELNACAEGLKETGKIGAVRELAKENGIPEAFVTDYLSGNTEELVDWMNAAIGKLEVEAAAHENRYVPAAPVADYLKSLCMEEDIARRVRRRTKSMEGCMGHVEKRTGELVRKGVMHVADLTCFHWARDYFMKEGVDE
ncbi:MAG: hypothetical protein HFG99_12385 [Dorea sp.]|jgi:hypothetical protein|nr:hypothetical protein [Dorea sp.]